MTPAPASFCELLGERRVIAVVRSADARAAAAIATASADGGLRAIEITTTVPHGPALIATLRAQLPADVLVGAGTVLSTTQLDAVLEAGARFVVAPGLDRAIFERCAAAGIAFLPGAMTPTEVMAGRALGLDALKLFPSDTVGTAHLRALRSVFGDVALIPTGGVTRENAGAWLDAGAHALGVAGELGAAFDDGGIEGVRALARDLSRELENTGGRAVAAK